MAAVFMASLAMLVFYVLSGASTVDASSLERDRSLLAQAVSEAKRDMSRDQQTIAFNDEAVTRTRDGDLSWLEAHIADRMRQLFGHDRTYVLGPDDQPIYAMENGETVPAARFEEIAGTVGPLVRKLRSQMDIGRYRTSNSIADIGTIGTLPAIIGVSAILRSGDLTEREPNRTPLIVSTRSIDTKLLDGIGMKYMIPNIAFSPGDNHSSDRASLELRNSRGKQIGFITWEQRRPGRRLMNETAPVMGSVFVLIVLLIAVLSERLRRSGSRLEASESHANHIAFHDGLTGLANRSQFHKTLNAMLDARQTDDRGFGLLCLDLDRFKEINDTLGHPAGDDLIRQVARRFQSVIGPRDLLARLSGDEFAILTPDIATIDTLAARLIAVTNEKFDLGGSPAWVSVSIGGVPIADPSLTGTEILRRADLALYQAKAMGRARSFIFDATLDALAREKRLLEADLRAALETGQGLSLAYQPLFGADLATIVGAEALIRWRHAERGNVSPAYFIPIAEERGLVAALGEWVIREACRTLEEIDIPWIAVNVSPIQLKTAGFAAKAMAILAEARIDPRRIQIEITEGVLIDPTPTIVAALAAFRAAGVRVALDDFGTGYASVQYLARYSVDKIKIDRSFVQDVGNPEVSPAIVRAMVDLAGALGIAVAAEGVETVRQRDGLIALGCGELQGYLLSRPISQTDLAVLCATTQLRLLLREVPAEPLRRLHA